MNDQTAEVVLVFEKVGFNHVANLNHDNGVFEIGLPEWSGFLARADAKRYVADLRKFCDQADVALKARETDQTVEGRFLAECCELIAKEETVGSTLYLRYRVWCEETGAVAQNSNRFAVLMRKSGIWIVKRGNQTIWIGVRLRQSEEEGQS